MLNPNGHDVARKALNTLRMEWANLAHKAMLLEESGALVGEVVRAKQAAAQAWDTFCWASMKYTRELEQSV